MKVLILTKKKLMAVCAGALALCLAVCLALPLLERAAPASASVKKLPVYAVDTQQKKVALTFNAAWGNEDVEAILSILETYKIKVSFFCVGDFVRQFPDSVRAIAGKGHEVQNHSEKHPHVDKMTGEEIVVDARACEARIEALTGVKPSLYRAPYGEYPSHLVEAMEQAGYLSIKWDIDSLDWKDPPAQEMTQKVLGKVRPGSIVLFHVGKQNTVEALPGIIEGIQKLGYEICMVSDLVYKEGYSIDNLGIQHQNT